MPHASARARLSQLSPLTVYVSSILYVAVSASGVEVEPVPSLLRDFSAPVKMTVEGQTDEQLVFLFANDTDPFNRCVIIQTSVV